MTTLFEAFEQASKRFVEAAWSSSTHWHIVDLTQPAKNNFGWAIVASFNDRDERNRDLSRRILAEAFAKSDVCDELRGLLTFLEDDVLAGSGPDNSDTRETFYAEARKRADSIKALIKRAMGEV